MPVEKIYIKAIKKALNEKLNGKIELKYSFKKETITITILALGNVEYTQTYTGFYEAILNGVPATFMARQFEKDFKKYINHLYFK